MRLDRRVRRLGADFHFGITDPATLSRIAVLWPPDPDAIPEAAADVALTEIEDGFWLGPERQAAVIPASNGIGNARSIARVASTMAAGGVVDGRRYLSTGTIREAATEQSLADDHVMGWCRYGLGFALDHDGFRDPQLPVPDPGDEGQGQVSARRISADE